MTQGKHLAELTHEVDVKKLALGTIWNDRTCICWQQDGTLSLFLEADDGFPVLYYAPHHVEEDPLDNREDYTCLSRFISLMKRHGFDRHPQLEPLFVCPVWRTFETVSRAWVNSLLADIEIDLPVRRFGVR